MKLLFRWINKLLCGWNVGLYFRPRIRYEGKKCLPAFTRGPAIIITNHKNQMDFLLVPRSCADGCGRVCVHSARGSEARRADPYTAPSA